MPTKRQALAAALVGTVLLSACAADGTLPYQGGPDNFGEANRQTMLAQVIDPDPQYDYAVPETSAEHARQAVERYRTDKVKKPDSMRTTNAGIGLGGQ